MKFLENKPLVSVVITTKNNKRTIQKCLESVKNQSYKNIELIVVDNYSTDGTMEISKKIADFVYLKGPERSTQRNLGAQKAKGKYLLIHDSDIYFHKNTVKECVKLCESQKVEAVIIPEESIGEGYWSKVKSFERSFYICNDFIEAPRFFSSRVYRAIGGYDENLTGPEDWDLMVRLREKGCNIQRAKNFIKHDEGSINFFGASKKKNYYQKDFSKYQKKHPFWYKKQTSIFVRFPIKKIIIAFIKHPILFVSVIILKFFETQNLSKLINRQ